MSSDDNVTGSASATIDQPIGEVFAAIADVTRMGEWSPECTGCRWVGGADGPAIGAEFEGDNIAKLGPVTLKKWTTTSKVTAYDKDKTFEFSAEGYTTWRFDFEESNGKTVVTESFSHAPQEGWKGFVYGKLLNRQKALIKGMQGTLDSVKRVIEGSAS